MAKTTKSSSKPRNRRQKQVDGFAPQKKQKAVGAKKPANTQKATKPRKTTKKPVAKSNMPAIKSRKKSATELAEITARQQQSIHDNIHDFSIETDDAVLTTSLQPDEEPEDLEKLLSEFTDGAEPTTEELLDSFAETEVEPANIPEHPEPEPESAAKPKLKKSKSKNPLTKPAQKSAKALVGLIFRIALVAFEGLSAAFLIYCIARANLLYTWQVLLIGLILTALATFTGWKLLKPLALKPTRIICGIIAGLFGLIYTIGSIYLAGTIGFLQGITTRPEYETQSYTVLALKSSNFNDIQALADQTIGFQETNPNHALAEAKLRETIAFNVKSYTDLGSMMMALTNREVPAITIVSTYLSVLQEDQHEFYDTVTELYTFEITYEKATDTESSINLAEEPFILYISGSDTRGTLSDTDRSDVNMLAVVNPKVNQILLVSIPRDYYVQLHGTTGLKDKLTHAGIYGTDMSRATIEDLFGIEIAHTVKVGFTAVENIVDRLGGIEINSDTAFYAWTDRGCYFSVGRQTVDGRCALAYARERKAYATGDRHRVQNQQEVLSRVIDKATEPQNLIRYNELLGALQGSFMTSLTYDEITNFAKVQLNNMRSWQIESISVNGTGSMQPTYSMGSQLLYVMIPDQATIDTAITKINELLLAEPTE